ncbi:glycosyltransferase family 4 protein [Candidatus Gracilibacteria bacterium]|nr:glycosyltransferase family 4 protein [Candidatus Gracilibacteria bacterium]
MKILYLITKSNWGGAQRYVYDLATTFSSRGHFVSVATGGKGDLINKLRAQNIPVHLISNLVRDVRLVAEIKSFAEIYKLIKKQNPDILHLNSSKAAGIGVICGRLLGVKNIVVTLHGAPFREDRPLVVKKLIYFFTWLTCLFAHKVITVSKQDEHDISNMMFLKSKVTTVYLGLVYEGLPERTVSKTRKTHIVTIAELHRNKGLIYALSAVNNLHNEGLDIMYSIFGEGEERGTLEEFIEDNELKDVVILHGHVTGVADRLHDFDLFLLPSVKEGLPYVLLEAGKAMLPVVTTTTGGIPEIVRHEDTGLLVYPKDVKCLTEELRRLIIDRKYAKKLGQSLREHVVQNFSHSKMLVETAAVYGLINKQ